MQKSKRHRKLRVEKHTVLTRSMCGTFTGDTFRMMMPQSTINWPAQVVPITIGLN